MRQGGHAFENPEGQRQPVSLTTFCHDPTRTIAADAAFNADTTLSTSGRRHLETTFQNSRASRAGTKSMLSHQAVQRKSDRLKRNKQFSLVDAFTNARRRLPKSRS